MAKIRLGYPCINRSVGCRADSTFRLASYSRERLVQTIEGNLDCMQKILEYNHKNGFLFFRLSSETVPFASHPVNKFGWEGHFSEKFREIGEFIKSAGIRISMHPDQFVLINSPKEDVVQKSIADLQWHCRMLGQMGLGRDAKVQIHVGGVYGDKKSAMERFCGNYAALPENVRERLVIENDDVSYTLRECMELHDETGVPVLFDTFHHEVLNRGERLADAFSSAASTWKPADGNPMADYSSQEPGAKRGRHASTIDLGHFSKIIQELPGDFDLMLEIKDKEKSANLALGELHKMFDK